MPLCMMESQSGQKWGVYKYYLFIFNITYPFINIIKLNSFTDITNSITNITNWFINITYQIFGLPFIITKIQNINGFVKWSEFVV